MEAGGGDECAALAVDAALVVEAVEVAAEVAAAAEGQAQAEYQESGATASARLLVHYRADRREAEAFRESLRAGGPPPAPSDVLRLVEAARDTAKRRAQKAGLRRAAGREARG
jgi:hypothetical protein